MDNIDKEIAVINKVINTAIAHGTSICSGFDVGNSLKIQMEKYLKFKGLENEYRVDNPDWVGHHYSDNTVELNSYLCFKKQNDETKN